MFMPGRWRTPHCCKRGGLRKPLPPTARIAEELESMMRNDRKELTSRLVQFL
jgi:hypothetical protein